MRFLREVRIAKCSVMTRRALPAEITQAGFARRNYPGGLCPAEIIMTRCTQSVVKQIRVRKEDSAFVYFILESYEGITSYSTLEHRPGDPHRDLELRIPVDFVDEVEELLKTFGDQIVWL